MKDPLWHRALAFIGIIVLGTLVLTCFVVLWAPFRVWRLFSYKSDGRTLLNDREDD